MLANELFIDVSLSSKSLVCLTISLVKSIMVTYLRFFFLLQIGIDFLRDLQGNTAPAI